MTVTDPMLALLDEEFVRRDAAFGRALEARGASRGYVRVTADYLAQRRLYAASPAMGGTGPTAANPDAPAPYPTPDGEPAFGSYHQIQKRGRSWAIDYWFHGIALAEFHALAATFGIIFPIYELLGEWWHAQPFDANGWAPVTASLDEPTEPTTKDDDMAALLVQPNDGDPAIFLTDGIVKSWVQNGDAYAELRNLGLAHAALDGTPVAMSRAAIDSLALIGTAPNYDKSYGGPRTTR